MANRIALIRSKAVAFIEWLGGSVHCRSQQSVPQKMQLKLPSKANESFNYLEIQCYLLLRSN